MFTQNWRTKLNFNFGKWFCHLPMRRPPKKQIQNDVSQLDSRSTLTNNKKTSWKASADFLRPNNLIRTLEARPHFRKLVYGAHINDKVYIMDVSDDIPNWPNALPLGIKTRCGYANKGKSGLLYLYNHSVMTWERRIPDNSHKCWYSNSRVKLL